MIVACGPESNGTRLLSRILETSGAKVVHRSLPHGKEWWHYSEFPKGTKFVAIFRDIEAAVESALRAGHIEEPVPSKRLTAYSEQLMARELLNAIPNLVVVSYETLVQDPYRALSNLETSLGVTLRLPEEVTDENAKYGRPVNGKEKVTEG